MDTCWKCGHDVKLIKSGGHDYTAEVVWIMFFFTESFNPDARTAMKKQFPSSNIKGLHRAIARHVVCKREMLTGKR